MIVIKIDTLETVNAICKICDTYKEIMNTDVVYGRYTVDGCSILGVASLLGNLVKVQPITSNNGLIEKFNSEFVKIGGILF